MERSFGTAAGTGRHAVVVALRDRSEPGPPSRRKIERVAGPARSYGKDEEVFGEGDPADYMYEVLSGAVRTYRVLSDGRRHVDQFHLAGDLLGLESGPFHRFSAEAVDGAVVRSTRRRCLEDLFDNDPEMAKRVIEATARALGRAQDHMLLLGRKCAKEKVASFLLLMAERLSGQEGIALPMSRADIADHLGLTIETVSRTLTQLEREGAIRLPIARRLIALRDKAALRRLASGAGEDRFAPRRPPPAPRRSPAAATHGRSLERETLAAC